MLRAATATVSGRSLWERLSEMDYTLEQPTNMQEQDQSAMDGMNMCLIYPVITTVTTELLATTRTKHLSFTSYSSSMATPQTQPEKKKQKKKAAAKLTRETEQEGRAQATASSQSHSGREGWHPMHRRRIPRKPTPQPIDSLTSILRPNSNSNSNRIPLATSILWGAPPNAHVALLCCRRRPLASTA